VAPHVPVAPKAKLAITSEREMYCKHGNLCLKIVSQFFWIVYVTGPLHSLAAQAPLFMYAVGPEELSHMAIPLASKGFSCE